MHLYRFTLNRSLWLTKLVSRNQHLTAVSVLGFGQELTSRYSANWWDAIPRVGQMRDDRMLSPPEGRFWAKQADASDVVRSLSAARPSTRVGKVMGVLEGGQIQCTRYGVWHL